MKAGLHEYNIAWREVLHINITRPNWSHGSRKASQMNIEFHEYHIVLGWRKKQKAARNMFIEAARGEVE